MHFPAALAAMCEEFGVSDDKPAWAGAHKSVLSIIFFAMQAWTENGPGDFFDELTDSALQEIDIAQGSQAVQSGEVQLCIALFQYWLNNK